MSKIHVSWPLEFDKKKADRRDMGPGLASTHIHSPHRAGPSEVIVQAHLVEERRGTLHSINHSCFARFIPTSSFRPPRAELCRWVAIPCSCHGRVLFYRLPWGDDNPQKKNTSSSGIPSHDGRAAGAAQDVSDSWNASSQDGHE